MKKNQQRVFAYTQAKTIEHHELAEVSGGASGLNMTGHTTMKPSASNALSWDVSWDVTVDL